jgi:hypothetical protein
VESLYPVNRGGRCLSDTLKRFKDPTCVAPEREACQGPHPGVFFGLCALEDAGGFMPSGRTG